MILEDQRIIQWRRKHNGRPSVYGLTRNAQFLTAHQGLRPVQRGEGKHNHRVYLPWIYNYIEMDSPTLLISHRIALRCILDQRFLTVVRRPAPIRGALVAGP